MKTMKTIIIILLFAGCLFPVEYAYAQDASGKKAMKIEDYGRWRSIGSTAISDNGNWVTFAYRTPHSNDTLYVKNLSTGKEYEIPRGSRPQ